MLQIRGSDTGFTGSIGVEQQSLTIQTKCKGSTFEIIVHTENGGVNREIWLSTLFKDLDYQK